MEQDEMCLRVESYEMAGGGERERSRKEAAPKKKIMEEAYAARKKIMQQMTKMMSKATEAEKDSKGTRGAKGQSVQLDSSEDEDDDIRSTLEDSKKILEEEAKLRRHRALPAIDIAGLGPHVTEETLQAFFAALTVVAVDVHYADGSRWCDGTARVFFESLFCVHLVLVHASTVLTPHGWRATAAPHCQRSLKEFQEGPEIRRICSDSISAVESSTDLEGTLGLPGGLLMMELRTLGISSLEEVTGSRVRMAMFAYLRRAYAQDVNKLVPVWAVLPPPQSEEAEVMQSPLQALDIASPEEWCSRLLRQHSVLYRFRGILDPRRDREGMPRPPPLMEGSANPAKCPVMNFYETGIAPTLWGQQVEDVCTYSNTISYVGGEGNETMEIVD